MTDTLPVAAYEITVHHAADDRYLWEIRKKIGVGPTGPTYLALNPRRPWMDYGISSMWASSEQEARESAERALRAYLAAEAKRTVTVYDADGNRMHEPA